MEFRKDINGLRALAVVAVMLYHFGLPGFGGGFAGVDVFFVISGFLMTAIIVRGLADNSFSLRQFYAGRARRLVPALIGLCVVLVMAGWFWLPPSDYKLLGRHAATALLFISNFIFNNEDGYFDVFSQDKWLLHTWSLSVEWQFYLIYPFLLKLLWRGTGPSEEEALSRLRLLLLAITAAGYGFSVFYTPVDPAFSFYLLPTRLWEMTAGGLVYLWAQRRDVAPSRRMFWGGLFMVIASIIIFDANTTWPGSAALLPVLGTCLMILTARKDQAVFGHPLTQRLGDWSYSIYLWHWPVVVALHQFDHDQSIAWDIFGIVLSICLGALSYYSIEMPLRRRRDFSWIAVTPALVAAFVVTALGAYVIDRQDGIASRAIPAVRAIDQEVAASRQARPRPCQSDPFVYDQAPCTTATAKPDFIVWGDSHASSVFAAIDAAAGSLRGHTYQATCPPVPHSYLLSKKFSYGCPSFTQKVFDRIEDTPASVPLLVVFRMSIYINGYNERPDKPLGLTFTDLAPSEEDETSAEVFQERLTDTLCRLAHEGRDVYVMTPIPEIGVDIPQELNRELMFEGTVGDITLPLGDYQQRHQALKATLTTAQKECGIKLLDPTPYLCEEDRCLGSLAGIPLYTDDNHLGSKGAARLVPMFKQVFAAN